MRTMKMGDSKFDVPVGTYLCRFIGIKEETHPEYGAGLKWRFEVVDGHQKGKEVSRTTGLEPTLRSACGKIVNQLAGGTVVQGQEIDVDQFVSRTYQVMVEENSTGTGVRVGAVMPTNSTHSPVPISQATAPPRPPAPPTPTVTKAGRKFWVSVNDETLEMTESEVVNILSGKNAAKPENLPVMAYDQAGGWKTAAAFGLEGVPF